MALADDLVALGFVGELLRQDDAVVDLGKGLGFAVEIGRLADDAAVGLGGKGLPKQGDRFRCVLAAFQVVRVAR